MNREEILEAGRKENKKKDFAELEIIGQAGNIAARVGALICCLISILSGCLTGEYLLSPWVIYFSIISTTWLVRAAKNGKKSDLVLGITFALLFVLAFVFLIIELWGNRK